MPIYEYRCEDCKSIHEITESIAKMEETRNTKQCPCCEGKLKKIFSRIALFTETRYFAELRRRTGDGFGADDVSRKRAKAAAERAGVSTEGKVFFPHLCKEGEQFSPTAWVGDSTDMRNAAIAAGVGIKSNVVNVPGVEKTTIEEPYRVANDIVERETQKVVDDNFGGVVPDATKSKLREQVRETITPSWVGSVEREVPVCSLK